MTISSPISSRHQSLFHQPTQRQNAFLVPNRPPRSTLSHHATTSSSKFSSSPPNRFNSNSNLNYEDINATSSNRGDVLRNISSDEAKQQIFSDLPPVSIYPTLTSIQHWQLRNLICASANDPNSVYYCFRYEIMRLDIGRRLDEEDTPVSNDTAFDSSTFAHRETTNDQSMDIVNVRGENCSDSQPTLNYRTNLVQEMPFLPMCFTMGRDWFVSGGNESELAWKRVKHLGTNVGELAADEDSSVDNQRSTSTLNTRGQSTPQFDTTRRSPRLSRSSSSSSMEDDTWTTERNGRDPEASIARRMSRIDTQELLRFSFRARSRSPSLRTSSTNQSTTTGRNVVNDSNLNTRVLGSCINNSVYMYDDFVSNQTRLLVSSNDCSIQVFNMGDQLRLVETIKLMDPVNFCSVTSNGRLCAALTDHPFIMLFDMRNNYTPCAKFTNIFKDGGFTCSFNPQNTQLAAGSQDGTLAIFDLRHTKHPLCRIKSKQENSRGAVRAMKYAPNPALDLLIFSEHSNYWHILDTRNFDEIETTKVSGDRDSYSDINIGGLDFSCDSSSVFVGTPQNIIRYQIDTVKRRKFESGSLL
mmetsp:Transcript_4898/g.18392  ORF Transcript_4898/g.18392 Transcript_4898/m.18392 type:complete len:583 (+) Transcript_4898:1-1749(+)